MDSIEQGLLALSNGDLDVMVTEIPSVSYTVARLGLSNLRITSITPYQYELRLAVRPDMPELQQILNKALTASTRSSTTRSTTAGFTWMCSGTSITPCCAG